MKKAIAAVLLLVLTLLGAPPAQAGHPGTATPPDQVGTTFAGGSVQFDLVTHGVDQYVAFYNVNRNLVVKHRTLDANGDGTWSPAKIIMRSSYNDGEPHSYQDKWDVHNWLRIAVDASGNLHVIGDMHNAPVRYWRTGTAGDLDTLQRKTTDINASSVTYPEFITAPNGNLKYLMLRQGGSGNGDTYVYEWVNADKVWVKPGVTTSIVGDGTKVFESASAYFSDGSGSVYSETFFTPHNNTYHILYNWRETGCVWSNSKMSYIRTTDFKTFTNEEGLNVPLPITADSVRPLIDTVPVSQSGSATNECPNDTWVPGGLINNDYQFLVSGDHVVVAYTKNGPNGQRQFYAAHQGALNQPWSIYQITNEAGGVGAVGNMFPENYGVVLDVSGNVALDHNYSSGGDSGGYSGFKRRTTFNLGSIGAGPFPSTTAPDYWPSSVYQLTDSFNGDMSNVESDSRSHVQAPVQARYYINSRPNGNRAYVISWLGGPQVFSPPANPEPSYPDRPIYIHKITY